MHFPTWVDLKGEDAVPETVHHVVVPVDPRKDLSWHSLKRQITTDGVHSQDNVRPGNNSAETFSEAVKILKGEYCIRAINTLKMDQALIFCRTKVDCDNLENYMNSLGKYEFKIRLRANFAWLFMVINFNPFYEGGGARNPNNPYSCVCLHGDRKPPERKANLEKFKQKQVKFLLCTDVAARGIDISKLPFSMLKVFIFLLGLV